MERQFAPPIPTGIAREGNLCYLIVIIQMLRCTSLLAALNSANWRSSNPDQVHVLLTACLATSCLAGDVERLARALGFDPTNQEDANNALLCLGARVDGEAADAIGPFKRLFGFEDFQSTHHVGSKTVRVDDVLVVNIWVEERLSVARGIDACLNRAPTDRPCSCDECAPCGHVPDTSHTLVGNPPFVFLQLGAPVRSLCHDLEVAIARSVYKLVAVCRYKGYDGAGHYTGIRRFDASDPPRWCSLNDSTVSAPASLNHLLKEQESTTMLLYVHQDIFLVRGRQESAQRGFFFTQLIHLCSFAEGAYGFQQGECSNAALEPSSRPSMVSNLIGSLQIVPSRSIIASIISTLTVSSALVAAPTIVIANTHAIAVANTPAVAETHAITHAITESRHIVVQQITKERGLQARL